MNSSQKEVQQAQLDAEKKVIRQLKQVYNQAIKDCESKIAALNSRTDLQNVQSIIYQEQYQQALKSQLEAIMTSLQANEYQTISDYLTDSYTNGYTGAMYTVQKQTGCTVVTPINQSQVVKALQTDSKLSKSLYSKLGEDISYLKKSVKAELSRGIANGSSWLEMASKIAKGMNSPYKKAINNAIRIARTEGHRIQQQSHLDALYAAEEEGADIVKQWDSTLDSRTRPDHRAADGQIRELDEKFRVGGEDMEAPGVGGSARNVCNCRCCLLQRAKWALDEDELATLKSRAAYYGLDKTADFEDFKSRYLKLPVNASTININPTRVNNKISTELDNLGVKYNQISAHKTTVSEEDIINMLSGGDYTSGSCASVALAYCGQKSGYNVLDFRGGESMNYFSQKLTKVNMWKECGISYITEDSYKSSVANGNKILGQVQSGKEYYLSVGRHASIVRKTNEGTLQYLELQCPISTGNGWTDFSENVRDTLKSRFGCRSSSRYIGTAYLTPVENILNNDTFADILGYINTSESDQKKGKYGAIK